MIFVVDFISPIGHKKLNYFFLNVLKTEEVESHFLFKSNYLFSIDKKDFMTFTVLPSLNIRSRRTSDSQGFLSYIEALFYTFYLMFFLLGKTSKCKVKKIFFTSYNCFSHLLCFFILKKLFKFQIFVFEHNSIPSSSERFKDRLKRFLFKISSSFVTHIVFENYIANYLSDTYNSKNVVVPHPCLSEKEDDLDITDDCYKYLNTNVKFAFSPSGSTGDAFISLLDNSLNKNGKLIFLTKSSTYFSPYSMTLVRPSFKSYYCLLSKCSFVVIGCDFDYRVSGVFYEALALSKPILINKSIFSSNVQNLYPNVFILDEIYIDEIINFLSEFNPEIYDFDLHNMISKNSFLRCISD